jgi:hypothetical protein
MRGVQIKAAVAVLMLVSAAGCTAYQSAGITGGSSEMRLSATTYQVRFRGNGYTSPARVATFMLRRAAELTLEQGYRYFLMGDEQNRDRRDWGGQYPERGVIVSFVQEPTEFTADAAVVIRETDALAKGRLSDAARTRLLEIEQAGVAKK